MSGSNDCSACSFTQNRSFALLTVCLGYTDISFFGLSGCRRNKKPGLGLVRLMSERVVIRLLTNNQKYKYNHNTYNH